MGGSPGKSTKARRKRGDQPVEFCQKTIACRLWFSKPFVLYSILYLSVALASTFPSILRGCSPSDACSHQACDYTCFNTLPKSPPISYSECGHFFCSTSRTTLSLPSAFTCDWGLTSDSFTLQTAQIYTVLPAALVFTLDLMSHPQSLTTQEK